MAVFALLQSRVHECWARFFSSSMKDDLRYTPSDAFETFPFPPAWDSPDSPLEEIGRRYHDYRANLMLELTAEAGKDVGLTATYNRFHDPNELDPRILGLRALHDEMDRAVLGVYGFNDLQPTCEFILEFDDDPEDEEGAQSSRKKKPWRYRWPDATRDEVLARLLKLNAERAEEERLSGVAAEAASEVKKAKPAAKQKGRSAASKTKKKPVTTAMLDLGLPRKGDA